MALKSERGKTLLIRNVPAELWRQFQMIAIARDSKWSPMVIEYIRQGVERDMKLVDEGGE